MLKAPGEYAVQSGKELIASLTAVLDQLSEQAGIPLSKLTVAVVSGTTAMESKAAGLNPAELQHDLEEGLGEFGRDVEYMFAGSNSIAVGQAFFVPCLNAQIGGDFFCSLLAIDILGSEKPCFSSTSTRMIPPTSFSRMATRTSCRYASCPRVRASPMR